MQAGEAPHNISIRDEVIDPSRDGGRRCKTKIRNQQIQRRHSDCPESRLKLKGKKGIVARRGDGEVARGPNLVDGLYTDKK